MDRRNVKTTKSERKGGKLTAAAADRVMSKVNAAMGRKGC
tara:strand:+ start:459 stop:578 length:120 start_codon:yes stop_codon:yes gene_type:complete